MSATENSTSCDSHKSTISIEPDLSSSPSSSIFSQFTDSSSTRDEETCLNSSRTWTYKLVGDNIDKNIRPREIRSDHQTQSLHFFHTYVVRDRVNLSTFSNQEPVCDLSRAHLEKLLPSSSDKQTMLENFGILVAHTLKK